MTHDYYNRANFPRIIVNDGKWDICVNATGKCAAIPTEEAEAGGHLATHFGNLAYVRATLGVDVDALQAP